MPSNSPQPPSPKLSICITTFNRAAFIGETLESILIQLTDDCEIVVLDCASTDATQQVVSEYTLRFDRLRYIRQDTNNGFDRDCDSIVQLADGEYCWLMPDDDLLKPGAVATVLRALHRDFSLIIVNAEAKDFSMSRVLHPGWLKLKSDRVYGAREMDRLFVDVADFLTYVGGVIVKRAIWIRRERERYCGSWFIYIGVIFQEHLPGEALVIAEPLISYRMGNTHSWSSQRAEILFSKWPSLVASLALSESARAKVPSVEPWRPQRLLRLRGMGYYSLSEYRRWIRPRLQSTREMLVPTLVAIIPGVLVNTLLVLYYSVRHRGDLLYVMRESRFYFRNLQIFKRERQTA